MSADVASSGAPAEVTQQTPEEALQGLCSWVEATLDQNASVSRLVEEVRTILGAQKALFFLAESADDGWKFRAESGESFVLQQLDAFGVTLSRPGLYELARFASESPFCRRMIEERSFKWAIVFSCENRPRGLLFFDQVDWQVATRPGLVDRWPALGDLGARLIEQATLRRRYRREALEKETLLDVVKQMGASLDLPHVLDTIIDGLHKIVPYDQAVIFLINKETGEIEKLVHRGYARNAVEKLRLKIGEGVSGWVAKSGESVIVPDVRVDRRYVEAQPSTRSEIAVPLISGGEVIGVFNLESDRPEAFGRRHLALLEALASQAAAAIERARLHHEVVLKHALERELRFAREIQQALLPRKMPRARTASLTAVNLPSRHVSGDLYDAVKFSDGRIAIAIGDVSGKGTPGAIMMATLFGRYRSEVRRGLAVNKLMARLNRRFMENLLEGGFATFFYSVLDPVELVLEYCNAGHNPPILLRADGRVERLDVGGLILGFSSQVEYERGQISLAPGDLLCLYTDGVTEAESPGEELFGPERLIQVLKSSQRLRVSEIKRKVLEAVTSFTGGTPPEDDITVVLLKVR